ncbi:alpha/beta-hydrolase [Ramaria rubella]|nr:alpha/beta-hydrolase [Ramaria rubella]
MAFTSENILSAPILNNVTLSPDGRKLIYCMAYPLKAGDHHTSSLWYSSDTTKADSARQLTSGLFQDVYPIWNPSSDIIFFLSDRHKQGGPKQIYQYILDSPGEPSLLIKAFEGNKRGIEEYRVSPDGRYIAFSSADEPTAEEEKKDSDKDDACVWGERKGFARLRLYTISTGEVRTLVEDERHVDSFTWSPDSKVSSRFEQTSVKAHSSFQKILYLLAERSDLEAICFETTSFFVISIVTPPSASKAKHVVDLERAPRSDLIWPSSRPEFYTCQGYIPTEDVDALAVHRHSLDSPDPHTDPFYLGDTDDLLQLMNLHTSNGEFAVVVASGMTTRVDVLNHDGKLFTLFDSDTRHSCRDFDVKRVGDEYIIATIRSSSPNKEAPNVWVGKGNRTRNVRGIDSVVARICSDERAQLTLTTKISSHYSWLANHKLGHVEAFEWTGADGVPLEGMAWFPQGVDPSDVGNPLPTILQLHGGPYGRDTPDLQPSHLVWQPMLAERGYLVLTPNYRGSVGRGHVFARAAHNSMGTIEWSDVNGMVDEAVKRGFADKDKLAIGGWSQGGFIAAWGACQTKNKFQCAVIGGGISDWGALALKTDVPDSLVELSGAAPWRGATARLDGDPIRHVKDVETAILILHGELDIRVPVGQGIGFHRGLRRMSKYPDRHTLVLYPREDHLFVEKKHAEDVMKRVIEHYDKWLKRL